MIESIVLKLTNQCNWSCHYCNNEDNTTVPIEKSIHYINEIQTYNPNILISLSGGEPGLLSRDYLQQIFNVLYNHCEIATNGTFLKNDFHNIFRSYINNIVYHVVPDIYKASQVDVLVDDVIPITYVLVVHKQNLKYVKSFIKVNSHIIFTIKFYIGNNKSLILSQNDISSLNNLLSLNIDDSSKNKILYFGDILNKDNIKELQQICNNRLIVPRIDLVENIIYRCCAGNTNEIDFSPLKDLTLKWMFNHNTFPCEKNNTICESCFHNFILALNEGTL